MRRDVDLHHFANEQIAARLGRLAYQVHAAAQYPHADAIHDLRVAVRRFGQSVEVFSSALQKRGRKKIRKKLQRMMEVTGEVRDRDIALEFLARAGVKKSDSLYKRLAAERELAEKNLAEAIKRGSQSSFPAKWRAVPQVNLS